MAVKNLKKYIVIILGIGLLVMGMAVWVDYKIGTKSQLVLVLAEKGKIRPLKFILHLRPEWVINFRYDEAGRTPLFAAVTGGQVEVAKILINAGVNIDSRTSEGYSPLFMAVEKGDMEMVNLLLEAGADVNAEIVSGWTPLDCAENDKIDSIAKSNKRDDIIKLLRKFGGKSYWEIHPQ